MLIINYYLQQHFPSFEIKYADDLEFLTEDDVKTNHLQNLKINEHINSIIKDIDDMLKD